MLERRHGSDPRHVAELARHYAGGRPGGGAEGARILRPGRRRRARRPGLRGGGRATTAPPSRRSNAIGNADEGLRCELLIALGEAEWRTGDASASRETFGRAARIASAAATPRRWAAPRSASADSAGSGYGARDTEAINLLRSALAKKGQPDALRARLLARLAATLQFAGRGEEADV